MLLLLGWVLREAGRLVGWPSEFVEVFARAERRALSVDCVRQAELARTLREFDEAGVRALLFKGAAVAHTHYPAPHVRVRADTDVFVPLEDLPALEAVVRRFGYTRPAETSGDLVSYQSHYQKVDRYGVAHAFDVHWRVSNLQALAHCVTHDELWRDRVPVSSMGPFAATVTAPAALLLALVHRAGHHPGSRNLLWMYDIHLLDSRLTAEERRSFEDAVRARGLGRIAAEGLAASRQIFGGEPSENTEPARPWTQAEVLRLDLQALRGWRARGRLLREHLLPSSSYMRAKYGVRSNVMLPALYVWRVLNGMPKWLRRRETE